MVNERLMVGTKARHSDARRRRKPGIHSATTVKARVPCPFCNVRAVTYGFRLVYAGMTG